MQIDLQPFPYTVVHDVFSQSIYQAALSDFPVLNKRTDGRTGKDLFMDDEGYTDVIQSSAWRPVYDLLTSESFVQQTLLAFGPAMAQHGCKVDAKDCYLTPFTETRQDLHKEQLDSSMEKEAMFVRMDFQAAGPGYNKGAHCDHRRRLVSALIYFCDSNDQSMVGGDLVCLKPSNSNLPPQRQFPKGLTPAQVIKPQHNRGVFFLCCNSSFHEVTPLKRISGERRWLYYSISSQHDIWPS